MRKSLKCHNTMTQIKKHKTYSIAVILFGRKMSIKQGTIKREMKDPFSSTAKNLNSEPRDDPNHHPNLGKSSIPKCHGKSSSIPIPTSDDFDLHIPIAIRKPVRLCTKYPMSKFVSYSNLSSSFAAFTSQLSAVEIHKNVQETLKTPKWKEVVLEEMRALEKNKTWKVMTLLVGKNIVGCKWVFTVKYNSDNTVERYKAHLVAKGFT